MDYITLNNGVKMPQLGYGVYQIPVEATKQCVLDAIKRGYRSIDTAQVYQNEAEVGEAIRECGVPREKLFVTSKIWISNSGYDKAKASIDRTLQRMELEYLDLMLYHQPFGDYYGAYRAMEEAYKEGKLRAIGISNFMVDRFIDFVNYVDVTPVMNQIEMHVFQQQKELREYMKKYNVYLTASEPLAQGKNGLFSNEVLVGIGEKYGKSSAQIALKFALQSDIIVIPKSVHKERMAENISLFDFALTEDEMKKIESLDLGVSQFMDKRSPEAVELFMKMKNQEV
ncbi:oxidoreductase, aldo/keto reductase family [Lachnospiraceae bacterium KM106-2]|nr:oxidoreductase, aldo/keto reductase family [Lachnospiraceae bacterium KM106-2]